MKKTAILIAFLFGFIGTFAKVTVKKTTPQTEYAATLLQDIPGKIVLNIKENGTAESFAITRKGKKITITANDGNGCIYGANRLKEYYKLNGNINIDREIAESPGMKLRGTCLGLQKTVYLPGHKVYEYPYTPENFPWFYDKAMWVKYLDMLAADNFNAVYLWNGHPFASLVKLKDYPFAPEVDDATMQKNQDMFTFITTEANRRGIMVIQMFYNIIVSKPFADHYGIKTQDRNRPITPLIADYTRKSIAAFIEKYPNVGLLICLGEAMNGIDTDIEWMTKTIIPAIKDGLKASNRTDEPPIILRSHDTDGPAVLKASLPLYKNIYTMSKYTGESLTTYEPRGPWAETHRQLAAAAPVHISNVHILANLEPWRWSSPLFIRKTIDAMHNVHHANGLHLYPQASYWDWPYSADKIGENGRLTQIDRDWMWYAAWGRYAWKNENDNENDNDNEAPQPSTLNHQPSTTNPQPSTLNPQPQNRKTDYESRYWRKVVADAYGCDDETAQNIVLAYDECGEIAPKLIRRFGITEGNRQTLLLGMKMSELVNPYKYTVYPGFYESCGPEGEKLIEYVEKNWKKENHSGELPLDIVDQCIAHGKKAVDAIEKAAAGVRKNKEEFARIVNDMRCYQQYAIAFRYKVLAAEQVLNYKWSKDINYLEKAIPLLEKSNAAWRVLVNLTKDTYLYANSMQTAQRRIPVGGDGGKFKTWEEMLPVYEDELSNLRKNIESLKSTDDNKMVNENDNDNPQPSTLNPQPITASSTCRLHKACDCKKPQNRKTSKPYNLKTAKPQNRKTANEVVPAKEAKVTVLSHKLVPLKKGALLYEGRDEMIDSVAPELSNLQALLLNRDTARIKGITVELDAKEPVQMLVGFYVDDQNKFASPPKLEVDASGNEYGQAEPVITNAIAMTKMPMVNIHSYHLSAGHHTINLPKGIIMVAGFTTSTLPPRDAKLNGSSNEVDWLFM